MYNFALRPSTVFAMVLLVFSATTLCAWLGLLLDVDAMAFDAPGWTALGIGLGCLTLSILFLCRVRWVRIATSIFLHVLVPATIFAIVQGLPVEPTISDKMAIVSVGILGLGLLVIGILALHSDPMKRDFAGVGDVRKGSTVEQ